MLGGFHSAFVHVDVVISDFHVDFWTSDHFRLSEPFGVSGHVVGIWGSDLHSASVGLGVSVVWSISLRSSWTRVPRISSELVKTLWFFISLSVHFWLVNN